VASARRSHPRSPGHPGDEIEHVGDGAPRVVIADDHLAARVGVRLALEEEGFTVSSEAATGPAAVAAALRDRPDVCLLDVHMPGGGIEAAAAIHSRLPGTRIVMLTASGNDEDLFAALLAGASGYLLKGMDPARLGAALRGVVRGQAALPRTLTARLIREFRALAEPGASGFMRRSGNDLTSREWEVLDCLRDGLSTKRTAKRLFISETTVRRHIGSVLRKLGVPDRESAVKTIAQRSRNLNAR
jgi:DNA-binding NarL/FixJ family response regulator